MTNSFITAAHRVVKFLLPGCAKLECHYPPRELTIKQPLVINKSLVFPRISIVVPSLNQGQYLGHTLKSILDQGYPNLELIVVDGGSTDKSIEVIQAYSTGIKWWVSEADKGQAHAINKGMDQASGEILAWLNSDDCLMPGTLLRVAKKFINSKKTEVIYGHRILINEEGLDVGRWVMPGHRKFILSYVDYIPQETMFWRASLWQKVGARVDESFQFAMDWELIRRFIIADASFYLMPAFLGQFRMHGNQKTQASIEIDGFKEMEVIRDQWREEYSTNRMLRKVYFYRQRFSIYSFLLRARIKELLWQFKLIRIDD